MFYQSQVNCYRYQAGESIYNLFDKVLILDQGRQVYYGPPSEARGYFENLGYKALPRQSTADYLTGCTDPNERQFTPGRSANDAASSPEGLENAFLSSPTYYSLQDSLEKYKGLDWSTKRPTRKPRDVWLLTRKGAFQRKVFTPWASQVKFGR